MLDAENGAYGAFSASSHAVLPRQLNSRWLYRVMQSRAVTALSFCAIIFSTVLIILNSSAAWATIAEQSVLVYFTLELLLRLAAYGRAFCAKSERWWHALDTLVVVTGIASLALGNAIPARLGFIRSIRVVRPLRIFSRVDGLRVIVSSMFAGAKFIGNVLAVFVLCLLIFGIVGLESFSSSFRRRCVDVHTGVELVLPAPELPVLCNPDALRETGLSCERLSADLSLFHDSVEQQAAGVLTQMQLLPASLHGVASPWNNTQRAEARSVLLQVGAGHAAPVNASSQVLALVAALSGVPTPGSAVWNSEHPIPMIQSLGMQRTAYTCVTGPTIDANPEGGFIHFDHLGGALYVCLRVALLESWYDIAMYMANSEFRASAWWALLLIVVANFMILSMLMAVVVGLFTSAWSQHEARKAARTRFQKAKTALTVVQRLNVDHGGSGAPGAAVAELASASSRALSGSTDEIDETRNVLLDDPVPASGTGRASAGSWQGRATAGKPPLAGHGRRHAHAPLEINTKLNMADITELGVAVPATQPSPGAAADEAVIGLGTLDQQEAVVMQASEQLLHSSALQSSMLRSSVAVAQRHPGPHGMPQQQAWAGPALQAASSDKAGQAAGLSPLAMAPQSTSCRARTRSVVTSRTFESIVLALVIANTILLIMNAPPERPNEELSSLGKLMQVFELVFAALFTLELVVKVYALGRSYFKAVWNLLDFCVVILSLLGVPFSVLSMTETAQLSGDSPASHLLSLARVMLVFRALRVLRLLVLLPGMQRLLRTAFGSSTALSSVVVLLLFSMVIYAMLGMTLFGDADLDTLPEPALNFNDFWSAFVTVFVLFTGESWGSVYLNVTTLHAYAGPPYVVLWLLYSIAVITQLLTAIILEGFETSSDEQEAHSTATFHRALHEQRLALGLPDGQPSAEQQDTARSDLSAGSLHTPRRSSPVSASSVDSAALGQMDHARSWEADDGPIIVSTRIVPALPLGIDSLDDTINADADIEASEAGERVRLWVSTAALKLQPDRTLCGCCTLRNPVRLLALRLVASQSLDWVFAAVTLLGALLLVTEDYDFKVGVTGTNAWTSDKYLPWAALDAVIVVVFALEVLLKLVAYGPRGYFKYGWHWFDAFISAVCVADLLVLVLVPRHTLLDAEGGKVFWWRALRVGRAFRPLKLMERFGASKRLVQAVVHGARDIFTALLLVLVLAFIFGIAGRDLFAHKLGVCTDPAVLARDLCHGTFMGQDGSIAVREWQVVATNFDTLRDAMATLMGVITLEGVLVLVLNVQNIRGPSLACTLPRATWYYAMFFMLFTLLIGFIVLNLFVGIVLAASARVSGRHLMTQVQRQASYLRSHVLAMADKTQRTLVPLFSSSAPQFSLAGTALEAVFGTHRQAAPRRAAAATPVTAQPAVGGKVLPPIPVTTLLAQRGRTRAAGAGPTPAAAGSGPTSHTLHPELNAALSASAWDTLLLLPKGAAALKRDATELFICLHELNRPLWAPALLSASGLGDGVDAALQAAGLDRAPGSDSPSIRALAHAPGRAASQPHTPNRMASVAVPPASPSQESDTDHDTAAHLRQAHSALAATIRAGGASIPNWVHRGASMGRCNWVCEAYLPWLQQLQRRVLILTEHPWFNAFTALAIIANAVLMASVHYPMSPTYASRLKLAQDILLLEYVVELALRVFARGLRASMRSGWLVYDATIVLGSLIVRLLNVPYGVQAARAFRVGRLFRLAKELPSLRVLLSTTKLSLRAIGNVTTVMVLVLTVYAAAGVELYGDVARQNVAGANWALPRLSLSSASQLESVLTVYNFTACPATPLQSVVVLPNTGASWRAGETLRLPASQLVPHPPAHMPIQYVAANGSTVPANSSGHVLSLYMLDGCVALHPDSYPPQQFSTAAAVLAAHRPFEALNREFHFRSWWTAMLIMLRVAAGGDWPQLYSDLLRFTPWASLYFGSAVLATALVLLNFWLAAVLENFEHVYTIEKGQVNFNDLHQFVTHWRSPQFDAAHLDMLPFYKLLPLLQSFALLGLKRQGSLRARADSLASALARTPKARTQGSASSPDRAPQITPMRPAVSGRAFTLPVTPAAARRASMTGTPGELAGLQQTGQTALQQYVHEALGRGWWWPLLRIELRALGLQLAVYEEFMRRVTDWANSKPSSSSSSSPVQQYSHTPHAARVRRSLQLPVGRAQRMYLRAIQVVARQLSMDGEGSLPVPLAGVMVQLLKWRLGESAMPTQERVAWHLQIQEWVLQHAVIRAQAIARGFLDRLRRRRGKLGRAWVVARAAAIVDHTGQPSSSSSARSP